MITVTIHLPVDTYDRGMSMDGDWRWRKLPTLTQHVHGSVEQVRQVLRAVIGQARGAAAGHRFERVERLSPTEALIRFRLRLFGREVTTVERVTTTASGVRFELVEGYLTAVEEDMVVDADGAGSIVTYTGRYKPHPGRFSPLVQSVVVPLIYRREVSRSLRAVKALVEAPWSAKRVP